MKKLLFPTLAITSLMLGAACDMNKKTTTTERETTDLTTSRVNPGVSESSDTISTSASSTSAYGDSAGSAAAGNTIYNEAESDESNSGAAAIGGAAVGGAAASKNKSTSSLERSSQEEVARPALIESDKPVIVEDADYSEFDRQSMEDTSDYQVYPGDQNGDAQLDMLEEENAIFYGNPGASGMSGAPGTRDIEDLND